VGVLIIEEEVTLRGPHPVDGQRTVKSYEGEHHGLCQLTKKKKRGGWEEVSRVGTTTRNGRRGNKNGIVLC